MNFDDCKAHRNLLPYFPNYHQTPTLRDKRKRKRKKQKKAKKHNEEDHAFPIAPIHCAAEIPSP